MLKDQVSKNDRVEVRNGARILLELLESEGVEYVFGNPGTTELPFIDALGESTTVKYIWGLQEASVVAMADGYAQASGKPGFINLHTAGGLGHGLGNLLNASVAGTPLVVTAGQQDSRHSVTDPLLFGDLVSIASPAVKWAQEVTTPEQLPILIRRAFQDCSAAKSGPVFLSLPMDVMEEMSGIPIPPRSYVERRPVADSLELLADKLAALEPGRLVIVAGDEISSANATPEVVALAEILGAPVFGSSWPACIPFPTSHPLWAGSLPMKSTGIADHLKDFDCVFGLGGKSFITVLYTEGSALPEHCKLFQLSVDGSDLGRTYPSELSLVGDIQKSLKVLNKLLVEKVALKAEAYAALRQKAADDQRGRRERLSQIAAGLYLNKPIHPMVAAQKVVRAVGPQIPIIDEALSTMNHVKSFLDSDSVRQYSSFRGGALGWAMPAAVGYSLGLGREPVVCIVGDGASMYSPQAIWTAVHENLPVTFIIMNNSEYNILKNFLRSQPNYHLTPKVCADSMDITNPALDFMALGQLMGASARRIVNAGDIAAAVEAGIASGKPNLIEIVISNS